MELFPPLGFIDRLEACDCESTLVEAMMLLQTLYLKIDFKVFFTTWNLAVFHCFFVFFGEGNLYENTLTQSGVFLQAHMQIYMKGHRFHLV